MPCVASISTQFMVPLVAPVQPVSSTHSLVQRPWVEVELAAKQLSPFWQPSVVTLVPSVEQMPPNPTGPDGASGPQTLLDVPISKQELLGSFAVHSVSVVQGLAQAPAPFWRGKQTSPDPQAPAAWQEVALPMQTPSVAVEERVTQLIPDRQEVLVS